MFYIVKKCTSQKMLLWGYGSYLSTRNGNFYPSQLSQKCVSFLTHWQSQEGLVSTQMAPGQVKVQLLQDT